MFVVTGYIVVKVNKSLYAQAICKYLKTRSTSSFLSSQHGCICYQSYQSSEMKEVLVSLYQLHMNEAVSLYYKSANVCEYALNSINIRQSNPITEDTIFNRGVVRRSNPRSELFVSNKERLILTSLMNSSASFLLYPSFPLILSSRKTI